MRLWAISDVHVRHASNRRALEQLPSMGDDWLALVGDCGEGVEALGWVLDTLRPKFGRLLWVPGNHELWTVRTHPELRGVALYQALVECCRRRGVLTPEDPYPRWPGSQEPLFLAPLFLLYDYSFGPDGVAPEHAVAWARESGVLCTDEARLHPDPYPSRAAWCHARCAETEARLSALPAGRTVLINHFPLRRELAVLPRIPRFSVWCGTRLTEEWHLRFRAEAVVYGHLHLRGRKMVDGVRFEEVSLGYPAQWREERGALPYLRQILPAEGAPQPPRPWE